jgi:hypothetical protein
MRSNAGRMARLAAALGAHDDGPLTLSGMCAGSQAVTAVTGAAIVLMAAGHLPAATYTSNSAFDPLEDLQFAMGIGPTSEAYESGEPVIETDLAMAPPARWGDFSRTAVESGAYAVFSFPLQLGATRLGALTLYQDHAGALDDGRYADAIVVAGIITRAVLALQAGAVDGALAAELSEGGSDFAEVHQASGMVSVQLGIEIGDALTRVRAQAFADGTTMRYTAGEILARRLRLEP